MWKSSSKYQPNKSGYYMTYYYNIEYKTFAYKAIYWAFGRGWCRWNEKIDPQVFGYVEESCCMYYTECLQWARDNDLKFIEKTK